MAAEPHEPESSTVASGRGSVAIQEGVSDSTIDTGPRYELGPKRRWQWIALIGGCLVVVLGSAIVLYQDARPILTAMLATSTTSRMQGGLNIAVAEFDSPSGQDGDAQRSARQLARDVYQRLVEQLRTPNGDYLSVQVWPPAQTGPIAGANREERARQAETRASDIAADVIVYGTVRYTPDTGNSTFQPEFYVSSAKLTGGEDLVVAGADEFGAAIESPNDFAQSSDSFTALRDGVLRRTQGLAQFIYGVGYYERDQFAQAADELAQADQHWDAASTNGADAPDGREVVYTLAGFATGRNNDYQTAITDFQRALERRPDYARAHMGLAEMRFELGAAQHNCDPQQMDVEALYGALNEFEVARTAPFQPAASDIDTRVAYGFGQVYECLSFARLEDDWAPAKDQFNAVVDAYRKGNNRLKDLAAEAYANLAYMTAFRPGPDDGRDAMFRAALDQYASAIDLSLRPDRKAFYERMSGLLDCRLGDTDQALTAYSAASETAPDPHNSTYQHLLEQFKADPKSCP